MNKDHAVASDAGERVQRRVVETITAFGADPAQVTPSASLAALDTDLLDLLELSQVLEAEFGVRIHARDAENLVTVGDAIRFVVARLP